MNRIVTIGGGTGSYTVLSGIKELEGISITALVSMADDGGSTGVLRDELGVLPPGDVRQCLIALSEHSSIVRKVMGYRFSEGSLAGHSFGNIFLAALEKVSGNFALGVEVASEILKVCGRVIPITNNKADLVVTLHDGTVLRGENAFNHAAVQERGVTHIGYKGDVSLSLHAEHSIASADYIILGPGNYFCSLVPCLIIEGVADAIRRTKAKLIFPVNLTNKHGHTLGWSVSRYVRHVEEYLGRKLDIVLINSETPTQEQLDAYTLKEGDGVLVFDDYDGDNAVRSELLSHTIISQNANDAVAGLRSFIRHDSKKLAASIRTIINMYESGI